MTSVLFKNQKVHTIGDLPKKGEHAPDFILVSQDLQDKSLEDFKGKKKLLNIVPSLDTGVCAKSFHTFYHKIGDNKDIVLLNISMDLPFAAARFCASESMPLAIALSAFRSSFPKDYGVLMTDGPLKGLLARAVIILDEMDRVIYQELVEEITKEPNYEGAVKIFIPH